jgi:hypothetical protein
MAKNLRGKRPCCICRKWFQPDVHQKGRQKTCGSTDCQREHHRRECGKYNKKNRDLLKTNYLLKKIEKVEGKPPDRSQAITSVQKKIISRSRVNAVLPRDIIINEYGVRGLIIIEYLIYQIINQPHSGSVSGFT